MQSCIDACMKCVQICQECLKLCLEETDAKARENCIKELQDCAEICSLSACFMSRGSRHVKYVANVCESICRRCADTCAAFQDPHCKTCADTCRQCADECSKMSSQK